MSDKIVSFTDRAAEERLKQSVLSVDLKRDLELAIKVDLLNLKLDSRAIDGLLFDFGQSPGQGVTITLPGNYPDRDREILNRYFEELEQRALAYKGSGRIRAINKSGAGIIPHNEIHISASSASTLAKAFGIEPERAPRIPSK